MSGEKTDKTMEYLYLLIHTHKYGTGYYVFTSYGDIILTDSIQKKLISFFDIDFQNEYDDETLELELLTTNEKVPHINFKLCQQY